VAPVKYDADGYGVESELKLRRMLIDWFYEA